MNISNLSIKELFEALTIDTIKDVATSDLVALWNAHHADALIKKFADRKTAEKRILKLVESLAHNEPAEEPVTVKAEDAPKVYRIRQSRKVKTEEKSEDEYVSIYAHIPEDELTDEQIREDFEAQKAWEQERNAQKADDTAPATIKAKSAAQAIAESWKDKEVFAKRTQRNGVIVEVNGKVAKFKSVAKAFTEFGLPMSKHIRFRMQLKEQQKLAFEHMGSTYNFELTESAE